MVGLTLLVCVSFLGLVQLALRNPFEHKVASVVVVIVGLSLLYSAPFAGLLLVITGMWTRRFVDAVAGLRLVNPVPDRIPENW